jgi:phosphoribosylaminoimidazole-succinocarboxamide synthase
MIDDLSQAYELAFKGKVRDIYVIDNDKLLIYTSDRISAFDFTFDDPVIDKGIVLTKMAKFWFDKTKHIVKNHLCETPLDLSSKLKERCMVVTKTEVVPIEAIVRGHLAGSAWETYREDKMINGEVTEDKLDKYEKLNKPIFTPSTKADVGDKDINISKAEMDKIIGKELADEISRISLALYDYAYCYALERGVIIADTKFEFGLDKEGKLLLIDEIFTPDCSRFWLYDNELGKINYDAFDKQFFRDYLIKSNWDNEQIQIPDNIKETILSKYNTAYELITHNE